MNNCGQWNMNQFRYKNPRNRMPPRNDYQHTHYQDFNPNFNRSWNSSVMGFEQDRFQADFRPKRGRNRPHFRMINVSGNNNMRNRMNRFGGDKMNNRRNSWVLDDNCYEEPINFRPFPQERKPFIRESSLPPISLRNRIHEPRKPEFFENRSSHAPSLKPIRPETPVNDNSSASSIKSYKAIRPETPPNNGQIAWSDSESDSRDASWVDSEVDKSEKEEEKINKDTMKVVSKDEQKMISLIWSDESDDEDEHAKGSSSTNGKGRRPFKYTAKNLPPYDGNTVIGDEGVFETKVFHCSFCNIICLDKEKSKSHMLTKYHYKQYLKELKDYEKGSESENNNEE